MGGIIISGSGSVPVQAQLQKIRAGSKEQDTKVIGKVLLYLYRYPAAMHDPITRSLLWPCRHQVQAVAAANQAQALAEQHLRLVKIHEDSVHAKANIHKKFVKEHQANASTLSLWLIDSQW